MTTPATRSGPSADGFETYGVTGVALITFILLAVNESSVQVQLLVWIFAMRIMMIIASAVSYFINEAVAKSKYEQVARMNYEAPLTTLVWLTSIISVVLTYIVSYLLIPDLGGDPSLWWKLSTVITCGTLAGAIIPELVKVFTSVDSRHVREVVTSSREGGASLNILSGLVAGNFSAFWLGLAILLLMGIAYGVSTFGMGSLMLAPAVFAFGLVAFGFLGMGPVTIAVDSYGPVTDNAQSVYELSTIEQLPGIEAEVQRDFGFAPQFEAAKQHLEENDGAGNTFKATAKPVLIGTAVVGATTMIFSIIVALTQGLQPELLSNLSILHPPFLLGLIAGGSIIYWFTGASIQAVTTGAYRAVEFIKANIKLEGSTKASVADSKKVVEICTQYAQKGMFNIFLTVFFATLAFAFVEPYFFIGYLVSIALFGLYQAIFMANAGGAWDNAKKIVETELKAKGTDLHAATVVGDTVGDPFKDTSSVALNPIIKFTTLFGLLAVELGVSLTNEQGVGLTRALAAAFLAGSTVLHPSLVLRHADRVAGAVALGAAGGGQSLIAHESCHAATRGRRSGAPALFSLPSTFPKPETPMTEPREQVDRRAFLGHAAVLGVATASGVRAGPAPARASAATPVPSMPAPPAFELEEATVAALQAGMAEGRYTARRITELYLARIAEMDRAGPALHAIIETNPDAIAIADELDRERKAKGARGPLHGIPVLLKDNIDTADRMTTTAGSLALEGSIAPRDSHVAERLRAAGAVLLAKTNMSEWANIRSSRSSSGWSARGGQCRNPFVLDRNPCGSSSGSGAAVSANFGAVAIGTETDGSIVCPGVRQRRRGHQADGRAREPGGHHPHLAHAGYRRPALPHGGRRGRAARRARRRRPAGQRDGRRQAARGQRLHRVARQGRTARRADRRGARQVLRLQRSHGQAGRGGDRGDAARGRDRRGSGGHSARRHVRRRRAGGAAVSSSRRTSPRTSRPLGLVGAGPDAGRRDRVQRGAPRPGDALLRPGAVHPGRGQGPAREPRATGRRARPAAGSPARPGSTR